MNLRILLVPGNPTSTEFAVTVTNNGLQNRLFSKSDPSTNGGNVKAA